MPTNRQRRTRKSAKLVIPKALIYYFETGDEDQSGFDEQDRYNSFLFFDRCNGKNLSDFWDDVKDKILADWILKHPCSRPWAWWEYEAPKEAVQGWDYEHFNSAQRLRVGGTGTPTHEVLGSWGGFTKGIPNSWIDQWLADYYNGRAKDIHGNIITTKYKEGDFKGIAIDPDNPPIYESDAAYLERHGLLSKEEKAFLKKHPELLEPGKYYD
ncbi:MAG: hypothetical protein AB2L12_07640 [Smithellaceae bacterium]